jgi:hypothetical protein
MKKDIFRQVAVGITYVYMLAVNVLAITLPLNNVSTKVISDSFKAAFVPAGYVFGVIWGLIYIALLGFTIYHSLPSKKDDTRMRSIGWWFALSNILNGSWIFFWHYGYNNWLLLGSLVVMLGLFATLIYIYLKLNIGREKFTTTEKWLVTIPFSIYLGWISIATIANITDFLIFLGWRGEFQISTLTISEGMWAVGLLLAGLAIAFLMMLLRNDTAYLLVFVWAFTGIGVQWLNGSNHATLRWSAFIAAGLALLFAVYTLLPKKQRERARKSRK